MSVRQQREPWSSGTELAWHLGELGGFGILLDQCLGFGNYFSVPGLNGQN